MPFSKDKKRRHHGRCRSLSYTCKIWIMVLTCVILAVTAMVLLYFLLMAKQTSSVDNVTVTLPRGVQWIPQCSNYSVHNQFDCYPENASVHLDACVARGCCYVDEDGSEPSKPKCVYPQNYGYVVRDKVIISQKTFEISLRKISAPSRYGDDINVVNVLVEMQTPYRLRVKFYDPVSERYEVPMSKIPVEESLYSGRVLNHAQYYTISYNSSTSPFAFKILRTDSDTVVFDTSVGALIFSHHFLELSSLLPSSNIHGFGGQLNQNNYLNSMRFFADPTSKISGVHPMYMCIEKDGSSHGVLLLNSNAMEVKVLPTPAITFRALGGVLDFYFFLGPTPEDVIMQYNEAVGRPFLPPYWSLGLFLSHARDYSVEDIERSVESLTSKAVPLDVVMLDAKIERFKKRHLLSKFFIEWREKNRKLMLAIPPMVNVENGSSWNSIYMSGLRQKAYVLDNWGIQPLRGKINGSEVVYPDYGSLVTTRWWMDVLNKVHQDLKFNGLWLVDNDPLSQVDGGINGCLNDELNRPPYVPGFRENPLYLQTLCMDSIHHWEDQAFRHYDLHNLYGHAMVISTERSMKKLDSKTRKLILSHSTFVGTGHYSGYLMDSLNATWEDLKTSIPLLLDFSLSGIAFVGTNLCESGQAEIDEELCLRWIQLGAFFPMSVIENVQVGTLAEVSGDFLHSVRQAIAQRYELLPYLYTLFYLAHIKGSTVMRPLCNEFPRDNKTYDIKTQFMWGPSLLISPTLNQSAFHQEFYLPRGIWYDFYTGKMVFSQSQWFNRSVILYDEKPSLLHMRSGQIIILQQPSNTTKESRKNPMKLLVTLNETFEAEGFLFWDDGESKDSVLTGEYVSVQFLVKDNTLWINGNQSSKAFRSNIYIEHVRIMGLMNPPKVVTINESYQVSRKQKHWDSQAQVLDINPILIPLEGTTQVKWQVTF